MANTSFFHIRARCLCGATGLIAHKASQQLAACHCNICRKWGGGPLLHVECGTAVTLDGEENITLFASSPWAERGFCQTCGTHLFYRTKEGNEYYVPAGLFDALPGAQFTQQIFIDKKPDYYCFADVTETMTEAEFAAKYPITP